MYAVVKTGGKQYRVAPGDKLKVELLEGNQGDSITLNQVLMIADGDKLTVGTPLIKGGTVSATIKSQGRHDKIEVVKFRRRKHFQKRTGHRQYFTELEITGIKG